MRRDIQNEINITTREDCLIWQYNVDQDFARVVKLNVGTGCQAAIYINGVFQGIKEAGSHNLAWRNATRDGSRITIIGINKDKHFKLLFGVGGIPFNDRETRQSVAVGIHGECSCRVADGLKIYTAYGQSRAKVTSDDIIDDLRAKLQEKLTSELSTKLSEFDYFKVFTSVSELSNVVKQQYFGVLLNAGVELLDCSISKPHFPEGYDETRKSIVQQRQDAHYNAGKTKSDDELLKEILAKQPNGAAQKAIVCSNCHNENDANSAFCKFCGKKLG